MKKEKIKEILEQAKKELGIEENIKLTVRPMKRKIASISLIKKVIVLNESFIKHLSEEEIRYIIFHELLHLKHGIFHTSKFKKELSKFFPNDMENHFFHKI